MSAWATCWARPTTTRPTALSPFMAEVCSARTQILSMGPIVTRALVRREKTEPQPVTLTRAVSPMPHLAGDKIDDGVASVRVPSLQTGAAAELRDKLQQLDKQGLHKLVLDLRDCARGPVSEGIAAAQLLIPSGTITVLKGQTVSRQEFDAAPDKVVWRGPVAVLISPSTSGAAEIIAAAVR